MRSSNPDTKGQSGIPAAALFGLCPKCAERTLFESIGVLASKCTNCGLDYSKSTASEGAGGFLTALIAAAIIMLAIGVDVAFAPPFWLHALVWMPLTLGAVFYGIRLARTSTLYSEYDRGTQKVIPTK